jgi:hypothetical protein
MFFDLNKALLLKILKPIPDTVVAYEGLAHMWEHMNQSPSFRSKLKPIHIHLQRPQSLRVIGVPVGE